MRVLMINNVEGHRDIAFSLIAAPPKDKENKISNIASYLLGLHQIKNDIAKIENQFSIITPISLSPIVSYAILFNIISALNSLSLFSGIINIAFFISWCVPGHIAVNIDKKNEYEIKKHDFLQKQAFQELCKLCSRRVKGELTELDPRMFVHLPKLLFLELLLMNDKLPCHHLLNTAEKLCLLEPETSATQEESEHRNRVYNVCQLLQNSIAKMDNVKEKFNYLEDLREALAGNKETLSDMAKMICSLFPQVPTKFCVDLIKNSAV